MSKGSARGRAPRSLSEFLKSARAQSGLSQSEVAGRLGYSSPQFVSNWERGESSPPMKALKQLVELYDLSAEKVYDVLLEERLRLTELELRKKFWGKKKA